MQCPGCNENFVIDDMVHHLKSIDCHMTIERAKLVGIIDQNDINRYNDKEEVAASSSSKQ